MKIYELNSRKWIGVGISLVYAGGALAGLGYYGFAIIVALLGCVVIAEQEAK